MLSFDLRELQWRQLSSLLHSLTTPALASNALGCFSCVCVASLDNSHSRVFHRAREFSRFVCPTNAAVPSTRNDDYSYTLRCWEQTMHQAKGGSPFKSFVEELPRSLVQTYNLLAIVAAGCIWRAAKNITTLHVTSRHWRVERVFHVVPDLAMLLTVHKKS